jgi:trk system potassium uptake protein TrkA
VYVIIVGAGDIGTPLIDIATESGNEVVVIDRTRPGRTGPPTRSTVWC